MKRYNQFATDVPEASRDALGRSEYPVAARQPAATKEEKQQEAAHEARTRGRAEQGPGRVGVPATGRRWKTQKRDEQIPSGEQILNETS